MQAVKVLTYMAFDFGHQRTGVATGNGISLHAQALLTIHATGSVRMQQITALINEWQPDVLIVGLPLHPDGNEHDMTRSARKFSRQLEHQFQRPVILVDERYSSIEADQLGAKDPDSVAACLILERYLTTLPPINHLT